MRDDVIAVYLEKGESALRGHKEVEAMRKDVVLSTFETDERAKEGVEYEKSRFFEAFKDQPDTLKKAKTA